MYKWPSDIVHIESIIRSGIVCCYRRMEMFSAGAWCFPFSFRTESILLLCSMGSLKHSWSRAVHVKSDHGAAQEQRRYNPKVILDIPLLFRLSENNIFADALGQRIIEEWRPTADCAMEPPLQIADRVLSANC